MEAAKTFERNGVRYRPGDALPDDLDAATKAHYLRHGMVRNSRTPAPTENKPAGPARRPRTPGPKPTETPTPSQTTQGHTGVAPGPMDPSPAQEEAPQSPAEQAAPAPDQLAIAPGIVGDAPAQEG